MSTTREPRTCATCGRSFQWRRKWARDWDSVRYCSDGCRRHKVGSKDRRIDEALLEMLLDRGPSRSVCPSEVARRVDPHDWKTLLEPTRRSARRLVARGRAVITQQGRIVDPDRARGAIRIQLATNHR